MAVKYKHSDTNSMYYCTFTCYNWISIFEITNSYDLVYNWFNILQKNNINIVAYVIMPNHLHCILYFPHLPFNLNNIISNAKRFMAYEIVNRLKKSNSVLLDILKDAVSEREKDNCIKYLKILLMLKQYTPTSF